MIKSDLIWAVAKQANITHSQAESIINITFESMINALYEDEKIELRGFGTFTNRNYKSYEEKKKKSGKTIKVLPKKVPFFKVGKELKKMVDDEKDKYSIREA